MWPADMAVCISMHQPWASLLVYGIKRIEGREWPTEHRGSLWVHATSQEPGSEAIQVPPMAHTMPMCCFPCLAFPCVHSS